MGIKTNDQVDPAYAKVRVDAIDAKLAYHEAETKRLTEARKGYAPYLPKQTSNDKS